MVLNQLEQSENIFPTEVENFQSESFPGQFLWTHIILYSQFDHQTWHELSPEVFEGHKIAIYKSKSRSKS